MSRYSIHAWYLVAYYEETTVDRVKRWLETTKLREPIGLAFFFIGRKTAYLQVLRRQNHGI